MISACPVNDIVLLPVIDLLRVHIVLIQPVFRKGCPFGTLSAIVAVWVNRDPSARGKFSPYLDILGIHQLNEILHNDVHAVLMEVTVISEAEKI